MDYERSSVRHRWIVFAACLMLLAVLLPTWSIDSEYEERISRYDDKWTSFSTAEIMKIDLEEDGTDSPWFFANLLHLGALILVLVGALRDEDKMAIGGAIASAVGYVVVMWKFSDIAEEFSELYNISIGFFLFWAAGIALVSLILTDEGEVYDECESETPQRRKSIATVIGTDDMSMGNPNVVYVYYKLPTGEELSLRTLPTQVRPAGTRGELTWEGRSAIEFRPKQQTEQRSTGMGGGTVFCVSCGTSQVYGNGSCKNCGAKLVDDKPAMRFCHRCGKQQAITNKTCVSCGTELPDV